MNWRLTLALKGAVTIALLGFLIQRVDLAEVGDQLLGAAPLWVVIGLVMGPPMVAASGLRWRDISGYLNVPLSRAFAVLCYFEGTTFNIFLPGAVGGDVLRAIKVTRARGKLRRNIAAVVIDRAANLAVILMLCLILLFFSSLGPKTNELVYLLLALATAVVLGFAVLMLILRFRLMRHSRIAREIVRFSMIFSAVLLRADRLARIGAWSFLSQVFMIGAFAAAAWAVGVVELTLVQLSIGTTLALLASAVPVTIAGLGMREGAIVWVLTVFGVEEHAAFSVAVLFGALVLSQALPGLVVWLGGLAPLTRSVREGDA